MSEDLPLARRIWRRYGGSPGVISRAIVEDLARRNSRFAAGGLAADIQRRWLPSPADGWRPALPLRWPVLSEATSWPGESAPEAGPGLARRAAPPAIQRQAASPETPIGQRLPAAPVADNQGRELGPPILRRALGSSPGPVSPPGLEAPEAARPEHASTAPESAEPAVSAPVTREPFPSAPSPAAGGALAAVRVQPRAGIVREIGPAILRRAPAGSPGRIPPADQTISPAPENASQPLLHRLDKSTEPPIAAEATPLRLASAGSAPGAPPESARTLLRGRPLLGATEPALQRVPATVATAMSEERPPAPPMAFSAAGHPPGSPTRAARPDTPALPVLRRRPEEPPSRPADDSVLPLPRVLAAPVGRVAGRSGMVAGPALPLLRPVQPGALGAGAAGQIQRQSAAAPAHPSAAIPSSTTIIPSASSRNGAAAPQPAGDVEARPDTEELVEQVLRRLSRSLAVERERRGWSR